MIDGTHNALLDVRGLSVEFRGTGGWVPIVDGADLHVMPGEVLGIVGESGSGKTTLALAVLQLLSNPASVRVRGQARFDGVDLLALDERGMRDYRGKRIAMIPQDPMSSLNPLFTIGNQIEEAVVAHGGRRTAATRSRVVQLLHNVRVPEPEARARQYPHELSGGLRQRVAGAIATAASPRLLIADEPTTALDVTVQARFLNLLRHLQTTAGLAVILITHDLGVVASLCDRLAVMYAGRIVEANDVDTIFDAPAHWYTRALLDSMPSLDRRGDRLAAIPGAPPRPGSIAAGCRFAPRCPNRHDRCTTDEPPAAGQARGASLRCWYPLDGGAPGA